MCANSTLVVFFSFPLHLTPARAGGVTTQDGNAPAQRGCHFPRELPSSTVDDGCLESPPVVVDEAAKASRLVASFVQPTAADSKRLTYFHPSQQQSSLLMLMLFASRG